MLSLLFKAREKKRANVLKVRISHTRFMISQKKMYQTMQNHYDLIQKSLTRSELDDIRIRLKVGKTFTAPIFGPQRKQDIQGVTFKQLLSHNKVWFQRAAVP